MPAFAAMRFVALACLCCCLATAAWAGRADTGAAYDPLTERLGPLRLGMPEAEVQRIRDMINTPNLQLQSGIALYNINQRIRLRYGEAYGVRLDSCVGIGTHVALILPGNTPEGA